MTKAVEPPLGLESFSCPHCGALAHQDWFKLFLKGFGDEEPFVYSNETLNRERLEAIDDDNVRESLLAFADRLEENAVTYKELDTSVWVDRDLVNLYISRCFSCKGFAVWLKDALLYPARPTGVVPHEDMPADVREPFEEAAKIVDLSARGAAALLRLSIQALMPHLGEKGRDLNADIGSLVKKGLEVQIQQALDVVRVIGNNSVHPGVISLKDDRSTAIRLFELVNIIVERRISIPKRIEALFGDLPPGARDAIAKRDGSA
jgi:hypothetical protein